MAKTVRLEGVGITLVNILLVVLLVTHIVRSGMSVPMRETYNTGTDPNLWFQPGQSTFCAAVGAGPAKPYGSPKLPVNPQCPQLGAQVDPITWQSPMPAYVGGQTGGGTFCRPYGQYDLKEGVTASK